MANILLNGNVYTGAGVAVQGATVELLARNTVTPVLTNGTYVGGTTAAGLWNFSFAPPANRRIDVRITNGTSISFLKYDDQIQVSSVETASLRVINPAFSYVYDIVPAAITADRQLNLPLITGTATLATIDEGVKGADIASGATLTLVAGSDFADVTGTTTVTAISTRPAGSRFTFQFDGALTLTHNATTLILQGGVNLVTAAGDVLTFISEGGGNWREESRRLAAAAGAVIAQATQAAIEAETNEDTYVPPDLVRKSPGVAKAWAVKTAAGLLESPSYNITSITDGGVGDATYNFTTAFSSAVYSCVGSLMEIIAGVNIMFNTLAAGSCSVAVRDDANTAVDRRIGVAFYGDQ